MPTPAPAWNLIRVYGTWNNLNGTRKAGAYRVSIPQRVVDVPDDVMIPAGVFTSGSLVTTPGGVSLDVLAPAVDDADISPRDWGLLVDVTFSDGSLAEQFLIRPSIAAGQINLRTVTPITAANPTGDPVVVDPDLTDAEVLANAAAYTDAAIDAHEAAPNPHPIYARMTDAAGTPTGGRVIMAGAGDPFPPVEVGSVLIFGGA